MLVNPVRSNRLAWIAIILGTAFIAVISFTIIPKMLEDMKSVNSYDPHKNDQDLLTTEITTYPKVIDGVFVKANTEYQTTDIFSVHNLVYYDINLYVDNPDYFSKIVALNDSDSYYEDDFFKMMPPELVYLFLKNQSDSDTARMIFLNGTYRSNGHFVPQLEGNQQFFLFFFTGNKTFEGYYKLNPLHIDSAVSKLQADTNRDLQKELRQTDLTNDIILEFTIVIVGAIPIGLGIEYRIERHIYELEKQESKQEEDPDRYHNGFGSWS